MKLQKELIEAFLSDTNMESCASYSLMTQTHPPDKKRKEVVVELTSQLEQMIEIFPTFNKELWDGLFPQRETILNTITIVPVVGTAGPCLIKQKEEIFLLIDLHHIADTTPIVSQMTYVMAQHLHCVLCELLIQVDYPQFAQTYHEQLDYETFVYGFSQYLAWNACADQYKFYTEKYEPYKEKAFGMLAQASELDNKELQQKVLLQLIQCDFWNRFPQAAGMFYIDDLYREQGVQGLSTLYQRGWKHMITHIFQS